MVVNPDTARSFMHKYYYLKKIIIPNVSKLSGKTLRNDCTHQNVQ